MKIAWILLAAISLGWAADDGRGPLPLSLKRAVELALSPEGSTNIQLAGEALKQARQKQIEARASLLPDLESSVVFRNQTENLAALGLGSIPIAIPGFRFPTLVGPFDTFDARLTGNQSIFDFSAIRRYQSSKAGVSAARADSENSSEQVAAQVARAYLAALKADADVETAQSNATLSEAVLTQTNHQKTAGTGTGIEITRARVQLANDRQHLLEAQSTLHAARLRLLRAVGLRLDTELQLTDRMAYVPVDAVTLEQAKAQALETRPDYHAQQQRETTARLSASATRLERVPTVSAFADYGSIGTGLSDTVATREYGFSLKLPLFDGGRRDARRAESESQYRAERVRTSDLKEQIELDVRLALDSLQSADDEVKVSREGLELAQNELAQARRRYDAGVTNSIEVTDAQTRLERARDNQTAAVYAHNVARIDLAQAMGKVRSTIP
jgi:outer membrane protein